MQQHLSNLKEIRTHGTKAFPCAIYHTLSASEGMFVKHHWHDEVEILYFSGGEFRLEINMEQFTIHSECLYFINPGELHSISTEKSGSIGEDAVVFSPGILSFDSIDATQMQLIHPIQNGKIRFPRFLLPDHPAFAPIRDAFKDIMHAFGYPLGIRFPTKDNAMAPDLTGQPDHFSREGCTSGEAVTDDLTSQLYIKSSLLRILAVLSAHQLFSPMEKGDDKRVEGIKKTLTYIRENYKEKIYIRDLAKQVCMNEQYFCRFFKKAIGRSPIEYVNEYRVKQSLRLLEETDLPITEVCLECGYNNLGNFLREFRKYTDTTPLQYRKKSE